MSYSIDSFKRKIGGMWPVLAVGVAVGVLLVLRGNPAISLASVWTWLTGHLAFASGGSVASSITIPKATAKANKMAADASHAGRMTVNQHADKTHRYDSDVANWDQNSQDLANMPHNTKYLSKKITSEEALHRRMVNVDTEQTIPGRRNALHDFMRPHSQQEQAMIGAMKVDGSERMFGALMTDAYTDALQQRTVGG